MSKATAKLVLFSQKTKKGFPLKIRITKDRRSKYIGLKHYLSKSDKVRLEKPVLLTNLCRSD